MLNSAGGTASPSASATGTAEVDFHALEREAQQYWERERVFEVTEDPEREKFYCLAMLPYPSGHLHMGHVRNYAITDGIARYQRMLGKNVLHPMGWDAFGLPAENAAIQNKVHPAAWTDKNIAQMKNQLKRLGIGIDWSREIQTSTPSYYRWEQWFFLRLLEKGIAYRKEGLANWDPVDQTVLANEQVVEGRGWRSGALIERRRIAQWFLRIRQYADELLEGLDDLDGWPLSVRNMQRNWIGRSSGIEIDFPLTEGALTVFTTRADTLFGVSYLAVAPQHPLALTAAKSDPQVAAFIRQCDQGTSTAESDQARAEKRGVKTAIQTRHPLTDKPIAVWVANFVLADYATGSVMGVPAHDSRDFDFAQAQRLEVLPVIRGADGTEPTGDEATVKDGVLYNSGDFDGLSSAEARTAIAARLNQLGRGRPATTYRLRDWIVGRQRYWGCPIPVAYSREGKVLPVVDEDLPIELPLDLEFDGVDSKLRDNADFMQTQIDGSEAQRESDTFDTFVESSWYYARYACPDAGAMLDERANYWLPVDQYVGGIEHAILHLLYARFFHKAMRDQGLVDSDEPFTRLTTQGMVLNDAWYAEEKGGGKSWRAPSEVDVIERDSHGRPIEAKSRVDGKPLHWNGVCKMSKSRNNGVDPQELIDRYGADTVRLYILFAAPPEQTLVWNERAIEGPQRFLKKLARTVRNHIADAAADRAPAELSERQRALRRTLHEKIKRVDDSINRGYSFNTAIAAIMELLTQTASFAIMEAGDRVARGQALETLLQLLAPMAPHLSHQLWRDLGHKDAIVDCPWPSYDPDLLTGDSFTLVVQVDGRMRASLEVASGTPAADYSKLAQAHEPVRRFVEGREIVKRIEVPGKLVNIVTRPAST